MSGPYINVKGGTGAGSRRVKKLKDWTCRCGRWQPGKQYSCQECGARRDEKGTKHAS